MITFWGLRGSSRFQVWMLTHVLPSRATERKGGDGGSGVGEYGRNLQGVGGSREREGLRTPTRLLFWMEVFSFLQDSRNLMEVSAKIVQMAPSCVLVHSFPCFAFGSLGLTQLITGEWKYQKAIKAISVLFAREMSQINGGKEKTTQADPEGNLCWGLKLSFPPMTCMRVWVISFSGPSTGPWNVLIFERASSLVVSVLWLFTGSRHTLSLISGAHCWSSSILRASYGWPRNQQTSGASGWV